MIRFWIDAILLVALSVVAWWRDPFLGVIFIGISISYSAQYWRMIHLLGWTEEHPDRRRVFMAVTLALIFGGGAFLLFGLNVPSPADGRMTVLWQEDFMPIWIGMGFFASLALIHLTNERKKR